jgi:hypothetical protein
VQVYIRADGTVEPATTPIERFGDVYVFANNLLNHTLEVQRDNIVVDGAVSPLKGWVPMLVLRFQADKM